MKSSFLYFHISCCKSIQRCIFVYRYKFVANGNTFVIVCNHIIVCDKRIYMYSTYWYTITLPWKFYIVREHIFLYWMCCLNIVLIEIIFLNISFIFKKFCRWLNVHKNICVHVLMYVWNSCISTQFCLCMCMNTSCFIPIDHL